MGFQARLPRNKALRRHRCFSVFATFFATGTGVAADIATTLNKCLQSAARLVCVFSQHAIEKLTKSVERSLTGEWRKKLPTFFPSWCAEIYSPCPRIQRSPRTRSGETVFLSAGLEETPAPEQTARKGAVIIMEFCRHTSAWLSARFE